MGTADRASRTERGFPSGSTEASQSDGRQDSSRDDGIGVDSGGQSEACGTGESDAPPEDSTANRAGEAQAGTVGALEVYSRIWGTFARNRAEKGSSYAWAHWQYDCAMNASVLASIFNGRDFAGMLSDIEERIKTESGTSRTDPQEYLSAFLRGEDVKMPDRGIQ